MISYFKSFIYCFVFTGFSISSAGSFDDFFRAIKLDDGNTVTQLINRGFDANTPDPSGEFALSMAIREPAPKVVAALLRWPKIDVEVRNRVDESPLMLAAFTGDLALCRQLIAKDADVNKPGWAPLHYA